MNKISLVAFIAALSLAVPALAQTPSDIRNGRTVFAEHPGGPTSSGDVKIDRHDHRDARSGDAMDTSKGKEETHHGKHHHHKHHEGKAAHHGKHHGKKHEGKGDDKKTDAKKDDTSGK